MFGRVCVVVVFPFAVTLFASVSGNVFIHVVNEDVFSEGCGKEASISPWVVFPHGQVCLFPVKRKINPKS